jgi:hypothetical protein
MASDMSDGSVFGLDDESDAYVPEVMARLVASPVSHNRGDCLHCKLQALSLSWITMANLFTPGSWSSSHS